MKIEIHVSEDRRAFALSGGGGEPMLLDSVILLTSVRDGSLSRRDLSGPRLPSRRK